GEHELVFGGVERLRVERDGIGAEFADGDTRVHVPQRGDQLRARERTTWTEPDDGATVGLAGFARVAALGTYALQSGQPLDPALNNGFITRQHGSFILVERPLHSRDDAQHLLFADLHWASEA